MDLDCGAQVTPGSTPTRYCIETSLPRVFEVEAASPEEANGWRESFAAALHRYDTVNKAMSAKHAGDVSPPVHGCIFTSHRALFTKSS